MHSIDYNLSKSRSSNYSINKYSMKAICLNDHLFVVCSLYLMIRLDTKVVCIGEMNSMSVGNLTNKNDVHNEGISILCFFQKQTCLLENLLEHAVHINPKYKFNSGVE